MGYLGDPALSPVHPLDRCRNPAAEESNCALTHAAYTVAKGKCVKTEYRGCRTSNFFRSQEECQNG